MKWRGYSFLALLLMIILLSGCSNGTVHVTVNKDESVDLAMSLKLDSRVEALIGGTMEESLINRLKDEGIQLEKSQEGKSTVYQIHKTYTSFEDIRSISVGGDSVDLKLDTKNYWLFSRYDIEAQPKFNSFTNDLMDNVGGLSLSKPIIKAVLQNLAFDFKLTLPLDLFGDNNATVDDGRTLTWNVTLADADPIQMQVYVPNIKNAVIVLNILLVAIIIAAILFVRKRKRRNIK